MIEDVFDKVVNFIYGQGFGYTFPFPLLIKKRAITREMSLQDDLKITGDDADEFLTAFGKQFNVDVNKFPIGDYFGDEGGPIILGGKKEIKKILTVGHLLKAVMAGRLDKDLINS